MNIMKLLSNKMVVGIIILLLVAVVFVTAYDSNDLSPGEITDVFTDIGKEKCPSYDLMAMNFYVKAYKTFGEDSQFYFEDTEWVGKTTETYAGNKPLWFYSADYSMNVEIEYMGSEKTVFFDLGEADIGALGEQREWYIQFVSDINNQEKEECSNVWSKLPNEPVYWKATLFVEDFYGEDYEYTIEGTILTV